MGYRRDHPFCHPKDADFVDSANRFVGADAVSSILTFEVKPGVEIAPTSSVPRYTALGT